MTELAKANRVLWLNSLATRKPALTSGRDLGKIFRKLVSCLRGPRKVRDNLWVYTPLVLPLPHSRLAVAINRRLLKWVLGALRWRLKMGRDFQLWTFLPNVSAYLESQKPSVTVYYCVDEWSKFNYVDGPKIAEAERLLCQRADLVFASALSLVSRRRQWNRNTYLARHGVDHGLFSKALDPATPLPGDVASLPRPLIGFYGTLQDWVDYEMIERLATRRPEWTFVLIGREMADLSRLRQLSNVRVIGPRSHDRLPAYCKAFSVGIIPYVVNERILHVNPLKLREYLCAGLPVVSVALPEVEAVEGLCAIARDGNEFEKAIEEALSTDSPERRQLRSDSMASETWERRVAEVGARVLEAERNKCRTR